MEAKARWLARAERREAWASAAEEKANRVAAAIPSYARDPAFITQPGNIVQRLRDKITTRERRVYELREKAIEHRAKAESLRRMVVRTKGDAERAHQAIRDELSAVIAAGSLVSSVYGVRRVLKVNAKSLRLEGLLGPITIDKALCKLVAMASR